MEPGRGPRGRAPAFKEDIAAMATTIAPAPRSSRPGRPQRQGQLRRRTTLAGWSFILPNFIGFAALTLVPVVATLVLSFMKWNSYSTPEWVGLDNFRRMVDNENFWTALRNTTFYAAGHIPLTLVASLGFAVLLNRKLRGVRFFRTALFFPYITSLVAVAITWNMLFSPDSGPINQFLGAIGIANPPGWTSS